MYCKFIEVFYKKICKKNSFSFVKSVAVKKLLTCYLTSNNGSHLNFDQNFYLKRYANKKNCLAQI